MDIHEFICPVAGHHRKYSHNHIDERKEVEKDIIWSLPYCHCLHGPHLHLGRPH